MSWNQTPQEYSPNTPLCRGPTLSHLPYKITLLSHLVDQGKLPSFSYILMKHSVPATYLFRYWQLSNAFNCQFSHSPVVLSMSDHEEILCSECSAKPMPVLYNDFYLWLVLQTWPPFGINGWLTYPTLIRRIGWIFETLPLNNYFLWDRLIQVKIVHRAYFTHCRVHKMDPNTPQSCWRCSHQSKEYLCTLKISVSVSNYCFCHNKNILHI